MAPLSFFAKSPCFLRHRGFKSIAPLVSLHRGAQSTEPPVRGRHQSPNLSFGTPFNGNWWSSIPSATPADNVARIPVSLGFLRLTPTERLQSMSRKLDAKGLMNLFFVCMTEHRWADVKELFEFWIRLLDANGNPNKPDVNLYNYYLQANFRVGASPGKLLDFVAQMADFGVPPNTASFNVVLKAMQQAHETQAAEKLIERMLQTGKEYKEALPDDESYDLIICALLLANQVDSALKYIDLTLKSGYMLSMNVFISCVQSCVNNGRLDALVSTIEICKKMHQNKSFCPSWRVCNYIADVAIQADNSELTYCAFELMNNWIGGENTLSVDERLVVSALTTAGRTYNLKLLDCSWAVLKHSLQQKKVPVPAPESYIGKIYAHSKLGNILKAFSTLHEFEAAHGNSEQEDGEGLFSPFYSLNPLVTACTKKGIKALDAVFHQLENLGQANPPIKSTAALNCIILGCANMWDADRAYQIFNSIDTTFQLTPNIHSYNALICAFGKLKKRGEAVKMFGQFVALGVKPNITTYSLLIDAHLIMRDPKAALSVIDSMICAGYEPSKEMLKKVRRRSIREMDYKSDAKVESLARQFKIRMGTEVRRDLLFNVQYSEDYNETLSSGLYALF